MLSESTDGSQFLLLTRYYWLVIASDLLISCGQTSDRATS